MSKTSETLDDRAARVAAEGAAIRTEYAERAAAEAERLATAQRKADEEAVAAWNPRALDAAVEQSRRDLVETVESLPLVLALAGHVQAQTHRHLAWADHLGALRRMGRETEGAQLPPVAGVLNPQALIVQAAENIAHDRLAAEREANTTTKEKS